MRDIDGNSASYNDELLAQTTVPVWYGIRVIYIFLVNLTTAQLSVTIVIRHLTDSHSSE